MNLHAKDQKDAIHQLALILQENGSVSDAEAFYQDVLHRESLTTTGIGNNIAIPHGKSASVIQSTMLFAKNTEPLEWHSLDGSKVNIIFLMAVSPKAKGDDHLRMLAKLSGKLMDDEFVDSIKSAETTTEVLRILKN
ncbi:PTS system mannose-specific transporter subunit IIBCA [Pediococcus cellicola]|uniref:PTS system mannose-specific transporter subunit IIBCA n=2 Tax=Pediococcus cellicola TaxID=319652 RepID=A0A0R2IKF8_9LACO|nr:PTS system mannose-specific transporter subunit IIBCA [Pediococcus cellicola]